ncbi:histone deacetylase family protein [Roseovarius sp. C7]|uniref:histone deacetylase family protein n=1 Tax=Roseovarius sp. C7 TaxID=3398643 RepID=UPI0039F6D8B7
MTTALITHEAGYEHLMPPGHPEQVARLAHVLEALEGKALTRVVAPMAAEDDLLRVHPRSHLERLRKAAPEAGWAQLDGDTFLSPGTMEAAWRAAGGAVRAVDMVMTGEARNAFVAMRPPGHHAERETPMGFCLFGTMAVAAMHALEHHGLARVAVVDFDVHHGNGTQDLLEEEARVFFASSHQSPLWPGSGGAHETGGHDNVLNLPLAPGTGSAGFRKAWEEQVFPRLRAHKPDLILVSAGFDAHRDDPLANLELEDGDFGWVTERLCGLADELCGGRLVSCLEGGYDLAALGRSAAAHVDALIAAAGR